MLCALQAFALSGRFWQCLYRRNRHLHPTATQSLLFMLRQRAACPTCGPCAFDVPAMPSMRAPVWPHAACMQPWLDLIASVLGDARPRRLAPDSLCWLSPANFFLHVLLPFFLPWSLCPIERAWQAAVTCLSWQWLACTSCHCHWPALLPRLSPGSRRGRCSPAHRCSQARRCPSQVGRCASIRCTPMPITHAGVV